MVIVSYGTASSAVYLTRGPSRRRNELISFLLFVGYSPKTRQKSE
jgi:hypothetical protein